MACVTSSCISPVQKRGEPYQRVDTLAIKQQLHDVLGENGLPYWQALTSFLTGRIGRIELEALVGGWLGPEGKRLIPLHNHLLISLISNASNTPLSHPPPSSAPLSSKRARRPDDPTPYGAKKRVIGWVLGMPKRDREKVKTNGGAHLGDDSDEEEGDGLREERRKGGAGWVGGSELERERVVLGPANGVGPVRKPVDGSSTMPPTPTLAAHHPRSRTTALESRSIPSADQLRDRVARISSENGLDGAAPAVGRVLGLAVETHLKSLITTHLHLHRSNLLSSPSIHPAQPKARPSTSSTAPSLVQSEPASPSATSSASSGGPHTPPNTFTLHSLEDVLGSAPGLAHELGNVGRTVGSRLLEEHQWDEIWAEEAVTKKEVDAVKKETEAMEAEERLRLAEGDATPVEGPKKKKKDHAYDYVDPRSILDSVLG